MDMNGESLECPVDHCSDALARKPGQAGGCPAGAPQTQHMGDGQRCGGILENLRTTAVTPATLKSTNATITNTMGPAGSCGGSWKLARIPRPMAKTSSARNAQPYHAKNISK